MRIKLAVVLLLIVFSFKSAAQNFELGKVSIAELEEKAHPRDSSAVAAILFKKGKTNFSYAVGSGFSTYTEYEFRIKIYKQEGSYWANQKVLYYTGYEKMNDDKVSFSNAVTYNLENGKIVKTRLKSEGAFKNKVNQFCSEAAIVLPNVKAGSVIEFKCILESENLSQLPDFDFQYDIPVNFFEYKTEIPEFFFYKSILKGNIKIKAQTEVIDSPKWYAHEFQQINTVYRGGRVPAFKNEKFIDSKKNYSGSLLHELKRGRLPNSPNVDYSSTWEGVAATIYKNKEFGDELRLKDYFSKDLEVLLQNVKEPKERLNVIFKFVQNRMNWNNEIGYYTDKGVEKAYQEKTGNTAEINFMLISMLKTAGIDSSPVLVSTLENGIPVFPSRTIFNYVIAAAKIDGKRFLLDASNKFTTPDILPLHLLNWEGRLIKENGSSEAVELIPAIVSEDDYSLNLMMKPDLNKIEGNLSVKRTHYSAFNFREINADKSEENDLNKIEIRDYKVENKTDDLTKTIIENFSFILNNPYDVIGGKIFLNPLLFFTNVKNPFVQEERQMPVYFGYPRRYIYNVFLKLPAGYTVESLPVSANIVSKGTLYEMNIANDGDTIQIKVAKEINKAIFAPEDYNSLKDFFQKMIASENEKIVLKKI